MKSTAILIPARYGSTRFPGKPLAMLNGVPMIKRVYDACTASKIPTYVLTDHQDIYNVIGPNCIMDNDNYENGTERVAGAGFTGLSTKAEDLMTVNFRNCDNEESAQSVHSRVYIALNYDAVLNIRDSGVELMD